MIAKKDLINGRYYTGTCRNTNVAMWYNGEFVFLNFQFTNLYIEKIQHYSDVKDLNADGFIPIKLIDIEFDSIQNERLLQDYKMSFRKMYLNLNENLKDEVWKDIFGYEGLYKISNYGRIKNINSFHRQNFNGEYLVVGLTKNKKRKTFRVHRLVALSFNYVDNFQDLEVNHINGIKSDNRDTNLEWVSHDVNSSKTFTLGNKIKKLSPEMVIEIKKLLKEKSMRQKEIAWKFDICESIISDIKTGKKWKNL